MPDTPLSKHQAYMLLNGLPGLGPISHKRLMDAFGACPLAVLQASKEMLSAVPYLRTAALKALMDPHSHFNLAEEEKTLASLGASFISLEDPLYPPLLRHLPDPPMGLYALGTIGLKLPAIAIVGSRRASLYGLSVAKRFAMELARKGFCIISGLARGIDTAAHEGALAVDGATIAVLGCGVDKIYPPENKALYHSIAQKGTILSEFRLHQQADKYTFPMRNRIISGLAHAVVVVETDLNGGSMITARLAGEQGKQVLVVPGRIDQCSSLGCHSLIREGATLVRHVDDILEELTHLNLTSSLSHGPKEAAKALKITQTNDHPPLSEPEALIVQLLEDGGPLGMELIVQKSQLSAQDVQMHLVLLELKHRIARRPDGRFEA
jgi:DNA processing protein